MLEVEEIGARRPLDPSGHMEGVASIGAIASTTFAFPEAKADAGEFRS